MQLNRLVEAHKALGDPNRLRIVLLLAVGPLSGQELAEKLGLAPATVTHHMKPLRQVGLVKEARNRNTIYFQLDEVYLKERLDELIRRVEQVKKNNKADERERVIQNFFDAEGRLKAIPAQRKKKLIVFEHLLTGLEMGREYTEKEIDEHIKRFHEDHCTIRREFIMNNYMYRENAVYSLNPQELWAKID